MFITASASKEGTAAMAAGSRPHPLVFFQNARMCFAFNKRTCAMKLLSDRNPSTRHAITHLESAREIFASIRNLLLKLKQLVSS